MINAYDLYIHGYYRDNWEEKSEMGNVHEQWQQGYFVDQPQYRDWTAEEKSRANKEESLLVRPSPTGNAICKCNTPEDAEWIAKRLNRAAELERRFYPHLRHQEEPPQQLIQVGNMEKKKVTPLNRELYLAAERLLEAECYIHRIGWVGVGAFIDWLEENYDIVKKKKEAK